MTDLRKRLLLLAIATLMLSGCGAGEPMPETNNNLTRWQDPDYRVTCWLYVGSGIFCLPESEVVKR